MNDRKAARSHGRTRDRAGWPTPAELFARPGEDNTIEPGPPLTPDERFRQRVAVAWAWVKAVRFYDHEHERLREVLVEMIEVDRHGVMPAKEVKRA